MALTFEPLSITGLDDLQRQIPAWKDFLREDGVEAGIYCDPVFIEQMTSFAHGRALVLVRGRALGRTCCLIPFRLERERLSIRLGPLKFRFLSTRILRLSDFEFAVRGGMDRLSVLREAVGSLQHCTVADLVFVDNVPTPSPSERVDVHSSWVFRNRQTTYLLKLPGDFAQYWASLGPVVRRGLTRRTKKLRQRCHDAVVLKKFSEQREMAELHAHMMAVWRKSWHASVNSGMPPARGCLERLAAEGSVRSYVLVAEGRPIAYRCGYQYRAKFYGDSIAYDADWREFSPGAVLNHLLLDDLFAAEPPREVDFGFGYNKFKESLGNCPQERAQVWVPWTRLGHAALAGVVLGERTAILGRDLSKRIGIFEWIRNRGRQVNAPRED